MRCPICGTPYFRTVYGSDNKCCEANVIFKKRQCNDCGHIWKTVEVYAEDYDDLYEYEFPAEVSETPSKTDKSNAAYEFRNHKKKALQAARELCYGQNVIDQLQEATSTYLIDQIMKAARRSGFNE